jgi:hypothetical protein
MIEYIDGLQWAAVNVSALNFTAGCEINYYLSGSILLIASLLSFMLVERKA